MNFKRKYKWKDHRYWTFFFLNQFLICHNILLASTRWKVSMAYVKTCLKNIPVVYLLSIANLKLKFRNHIKSSQSVYTMIHFHLYLVKYQKSYKCFVNHSILYLFHSWALPVCLIWLKLIDFIIFFYLFLLKNKGVINFE